MTDLSGVHIFVRYIGKLRWRAWNVHLGAPTQVGGAATIGRINIGLPIVISSISSRRSPSQFLWPCNDIPTFLCRHGRCLIDTLQTHTTHVNASRWELKFSFSGSFESSEIRTVGSRRQRSQSVDGFSVRQRRSGLCWLPVSIRVIVLQQVLSLSL